MVAKNWYTTLLHVRNVLCYKDRHVSLPSSHLAWDYVTMTPVNPLQYSGKLHGVSFKRQTLLSLSRLQFRKNY
jgi:hypothetical protein